MDELDWQALAVHAEHSYLTDNLFHAMVEVVVQRRIKETQNAIRRVNSLCDSVRQLQKPDSDTGDRQVSFFALLDALESDDEP